VQQQRKEVVGVYYRFRNVQIEGREREDFFGSWIPGRKEKTGSLVVSDFMA
jgi:hypothetical protein